MKSYFAVLVFLLFSNFSFAKSNIVGVWIDEGNTLAVQILDNPSQGPFTAGELWQSIKEDSLNAKGKRWVKTENFELTCDGLKDTWGNIFGNCRILISRNKVMAGASNVNFAISKIEGGNALAHFIKPNSAENILIKAPMFDENDEDFEQERSSFIFEGNWKYQMIGVVLDKQLVTE